MNFKERLANVKIDLLQFYSLGIVCFLLIAISSIISLVYNWNFLIWSGKISSIFSIIFNFGIVLFFNYLKGTVPGQQKLSNAPEDIDFDKMIEDSM